MLHDYQKNKKAQFYRDYLGVVGYWLTIRNRKTIQKVVFHNRHRRWEGHCKGGSGTWDLHRRYPKL